MALARKIISLIITGFLVGIVFGSLVNLGWAIIFFFLLLSLSFVGLFFIYRQDTERKKIFIIISLFFLGITLGLFRLEILNNLVARKNVISQPNYFGLIVADPDRRDKTTRLVVELAPVRSRTSSELEVRLRTGDRLLLVTDNFTDYAYGDKIEFKGKIEKPSNFITPHQNGAGQAAQGKVFDYQNYLLVRGITEVGYYPKIKILARDQGSVIKAWLFKLKNNFLGNLRQTLPEPSASLAGGLILGDKGGLGSKTENEFRQAGVSHIIVLSGFNITVVAETVLRVFSWLSPAFAWLLGIGSIFLFVMMTGGEAAAVRSAVMGAIALVARKYGRTYDAGVALIVAGFLMVLWNPRLLVFDFGFQLSFLATCGMIYISPLISQLGGFTSKLKLKELISTTIGAQIAVYPWLLYKTGNATLVGFISNLFILPAVPMAMLGSFLTGIAGFVSYYLSLIISYPTYFLLFYILKLASLFSLL